VSYYSDVVGVTTLLKEFRAMATASEPFKVTLGLTSMEVMWLHQCIEFQIRMLIRSRGKEVTGGEMYALRSKEIESLRALSQRF